MIVRGKRVVYKYDLAPSVDIFFSNADFDIFIQYPDGSYETLTYEEAERRSEREKELEEICKRPLINYKPQK